MNKSIRNIVAAFVGLASVSAPAAVSAQVEKRVEVTKTYQAVFSESVKLPITPDMSDTVAMRPDIEYGITPLMYPANLSTHTLKPASVTYWEFNRPRNFYAKLGAGFPLNGVADFYASMHDAHIGYAMAYVNHLGQYGNIKNDSGLKQNALQASTVAGAGGGVYWGKRMFEGGLEYRSEIDRRYASNIKGRDPLAEYEDFAVKLRFGDDFSDLDRVNFNIDAYGDFFHDKSEWTMKNIKLQQFVFGGKGRVARRFGRHYAEIAAAYDGGRGIKTLKEYKSNTIAAGVRYGYTSRNSLVDLLAGVDYVYDKISTRPKAAHYLLPHMRLQLNVSSSGAVIPFIEAEGAMHNNSYRSLAYSNPYVEYWTGDNGVASLLSLPSTVDYSIRGGVSGKVAHGKVGYRVFIDATFSENSIYWYNRDYMWLRPVAARRDVLSLNAEVDYRPLSNLTLGIGARGKLFKDYASVADHELAGGESPFDAWFTARYKHRRFSVGAYARYCSAATWSSLIYDDPNDATIYRWKDARMKGYVDVGVECDVRINEDWMIFLEGTNLANMRIHHLAYYPEQGIRATVGVKFTF